MIAISLLALCCFTPPKDWTTADPKCLAPRVKSAYVGKNNSGFCPSINLATEEVSITVEEYLKVVKKLYALDRDIRWRDLGKIQTKAGSARLTEIDTKTEFGNIRMLQMILVKEGQAYIMTAAASKENFSQHYKDFEQAFRSFDIPKD